MLSEKTLWGFGEYFASYHSNIMFCLLSSSGPGPDIREYLWESKVYRWTEEDVVRVRDGQGWF